MNDTREVGQSVAAYNYKLVDADTGEEIVLPARRKCWDGEEITIRSFKPSRFQGNEGYIYTNQNMCYTPGICRAKIVTA